MGEVVFLAVANKKEVWVSPASSVDASGIVRQFYITKTWDPSIFDGVTIKVTKSSLKKEKMPRRADSNTWHSPILYCNTHREARVGDIILLRHEGVVEKETPEVKALTFESHKFVGPLSLHTSKSKTSKNLLGFIHAPYGFSVEHPEHDNVEGLPPGWYEVRRARTWEAHPNGIWSGTID